MANHPLLVTYQAKVNSGQDNVTIHDEFCYINKPPLNYIFVSIKSSLASPPCVVESFVHEEDISTV